MVTYINKGECLKSVFIYVVRTLLILTVPEINDRYVQRHLVYRGYNAWSGGCQIGCDVLRQMSLLKDTLNHAVKVR